jgi:predicted ester cyclase
MGEKITLPFLKERTSKLWNEGDFTVLDELFDAGFVGHEPSQGVINGREGMATHVAGLRAQYPDLKITGLEDIFDGRTYVTRWRYEGTDTGEFEGRLAPPTGKKVDFLGTSIYHLEHDKIVEEFRYCDMLLVYQQLGLIPETIG